MLTGVSSPRAAGRASAGTAAGARRPWDGSSRYELPNDNNPIWAPTPPVVVADIATDRLYGPSMSDAPPANWTASVMNEEKITDRTRAIMVVHLHGLPADMERIDRIARRHGLKVIEDAAQAYGARYRGRKTGALGDAAGFAMTTTKHLMTGEGGLLTTDNPEIHERAAMTRLFGEPASMKDPTRAYLSERIGWNYKMPEVISALARVRLRHLDAYVSGLQGNAEYLTERLGDIDGLRARWCPRAAPTATTSTPSRSIRPG